MIDVTTECPRNIRVGRLALGYSGEKLFGIQRGVDSENVVMLILGVRDFATEMWRNGNGREIQIRTARFGIAGRGSWDHLSSLSSQWQHKNSGINGGTRISARFGLGAR